MILNIEPVAIYDGCGYHIEDLIQITSNGTKVLTESSALLNNICFLLQYFQ